MPRSTLSVANAWDRPVDVLGPPFSIGSQLTLAIELAASPVKQTGRESLFHGLRNSYELDDVRSTTGFACLGVDGARIGRRALGVGAPDSSGSTFFVACPSLHDALALGRPDGRGDVEYRLLDQTNGQIKALALPDQEEWSMLSVSPWRDKDGNLEAAGRWVCRRDGEEEFCGIGCLTLPELTVRNRVTLDVLPTGKLCWVNDRPGDVLFPAGDGQLYRCHIAGQGRESTRDSSRSDPRKNEGTVLKARPVAWEMEMPGSAVAFLNDPAVSSKPLLGHLVFVSMSIKGFHEGRRVILPSKLWWLVMNDAGDKIVNAGRLTEPGPEEAGNDPISERLPIVVTGASGDTSLALPDPDRGPELMPAPVGQARHRRGDRATANAVRRRLECVGQGRQAVAARGFGQRQVRLRDRWLRPDRQAFDSLVIAVSQFRSGTTRRSLAPSCRLTVRCVMLVVRTSAHIAGG